MNAIMPTTYSIWNILQLQSSKGLPNRFAKTNQLICKRFLSDLQRGTVILWCHSKSYLVCFYIGVVIHSWCQLPSVKITFPSSSNTTTSYSTKRYPYKHNRVINMNRYLDFLVIFKGGTAISRNKIRARRCDLWGRQCDWIWSAGD